MSKTVSRNKLEYFLEDLDCECCLYYLGKSKYRRNGCNCDICRFEAEKCDALENGRIKRLRPISCQG